MPRRTKAIQLLVNQALPPELRDPSRQLDEKDVNDLLVRVAKQYPDQYAQIAKNLSDAGRLASYRRGLTVRLRDLKPPLDTQPMYDQMDQEIALAKKSIRDPEQFRQAREAIWHTWSKRIDQEGIRAGLQQGNNLARAVASGARGKSGHFKAMTMTPALFEDSAGRTVPMFVRRSYGQGLRPAEYLATSHGTRQAIVSTKVSTARGGHLGKLFTQVTAPLIVTTRDCGTDNGIDLDPDDPSLAGRVLARPYGPAGLDPGTPLDDDAMAELMRGISRAGAKDKKPAPPVLVRSPLTCEAREGLCQQCAGLEPEGRFPKIGASVGITAGQALSEPVIQGALSVKHQGGAASGKRQFSGLDVIERFVNSPEHFPGAALAAPKDGTVQSTREAPQGGQYVTFADQEGQMEEMYVPPDQSLTVRVGDPVEAGEALTDGLLDPYGVVEKRGLGEGRRYWVERFGQILADSGAPPQKRNLEFVARAALDHVHVRDDERMDGFLPGDVTSYERATQALEIPETAKQLSPREAVGQYLQRPALHLTVGTRLTPKQAERLEKAGYGNVWVDPTEPPFRPEMIRLAGAAGQTPDWIASQHTSYIKKNLTEHAVRGSDSNVEQNVHFAPRLAIGERYGKDIEQTGKF